MTGPPDLPPPPPTMAGGPPGAPVPPGHDPRRNLLLAIAGVIAGIAIVVVLVFLLMPRQQQAGPTAATPTVTPVPSVATPVVTVPPTSAPTSAPPPPSHSASTAPQIVSFSGPSSVSCAGGGNKDITLTWVTKHDTGVNIGIENTGPYNSSPLPPSGSTTYPFACGSNTSGVTHHYYLTTVGGTNPALKEITIRSN